MVLVVLAAKCAGFTLAYLGLKPGLEAHPASPTLATYYTYCTQHCSVPHCNCPSAAVQWPPNISLLHLLHLALQRPSAAVRCIEQPASPHCLYLLHSTLFTQLYFKCSALQHFSAMLNTALQRFSNCSSVSTIVSTTPHIEPRCTTAHCITLHQRTTKAKCVKMCQHQDHFLIQQHCHHDHNPHHHHRHHNHHHRHNLDRMACGKVRWLRVGWN